MCLTGVWHLDLDLDMVTSLYYTNDLNLVHKFSNMSDPNFGSLY